MKVPTSMYINKINANVTDKSAHRRVGSPTDENISRFAINTKDRQWP